MTRGDDDDSVVLNPQKTGIVLPFWSVITGVLTLLIAGASVGTIVFNMKDAIRQNIETNTANQVQQMVLLKQLACLTRWQVYNSRKADAQYRGECE